MLFTRTVAALAVASLAIAAPVEDVIKKDFTVSQVASKKVLKAGAIAYAKALNKFRAPVPAHVASAAAAAAAQQGSVTASPEQYDQEYLCPVKLSTGSQTLQLDFDTGSADLWVFSTLQPSSQTSGHTIYNPSTSGKKKSGYTWNISYGDGSGAKGVVYSDKVVIGGVTATSQAVEAATSVSSQFVQDTDNDGLVGLAFSSINTVSPQQQTTFFDTVKSSLSSPLFTAKLKYQAAGTYDFGYIDSSKYTGSITYSSINTQNGFWEFTYSGYAVGTTTYSGSFDAIADTGTSLILVDDSIVSNYYAKVSGAYNSNSYGGYVFPCSATLPTFSIITNGVKHTVPGKYMNYAPVSSSTCYGGIQSDDGIGFNILGDVFLKSQFVVFDSNGPRIGFANQS